MYFSVAYAILCHSLTMVTVTSHIFISIFQMVHFSVVKFTRGNKNNMSFLLIPESQKVWKNLKQSDRAPLMPLHWIVIMSSPLDLFAQNMLDQNTGCLRKKYGVANYQYFKNGSTWQYIFRHENATFIDLCVKLQLNVSNIIQLWTLEEWWLKQDLDVKI